jgi:hypothetical protein
MITENGLFGQKNQSSRLRKNRKIPKNCIFFQNPKMTPFAILSLIVIYFGILFAISHFTSKRHGNDAFFQQTKILNGT